MMIEIVNRLNYLEDKMKDFQSLNNTTKLTLDILKARVMQLEDMLEASGIAIDEPITNYGGSK